MTPRPTRGRSCIFLLTLLSVTATCLAVDLRHRSLSNSGQFAIYCDDRDLRGRVVGFVEEIKGEILRALHEGDDWKFPIVVAIEHESAPQAQSAPVSITLVNTVAGPKGLGRGSGRAVAMSEIATIRARVALFGLCMGRTV